MENEIKKECARRSFACKSSEYITKTDWLGKKPNRITEKKLLLEEENKKQITFSSKLNALKPVRPK